MNLKEEIRKAREAKTPVNKARSGSFSNGGLTLVYCSCGKRLEFSKNLTNMLNNPISVVIKFSDTYMFIESNENGHSLKDMCGKKVLYNAALLKEAIEFFELDFTNRKSITLSNIVHVDDMENTIAIKRKDNLYENSSAGCI